MVLNCSVHTTNLALQIKCLPNKYWFLRLIVRLNDIEELYNNKRSSLNCFFITSTSVSDDLDHLIIVCTVLRLAGHGRQLGNNWHQGCSGNHLAPCCAAYCAFLSDGPPHCFVFGIYLLMSTKLMGESLLGYLLSHLKKIKIGLFV